jgi:hypothetical protein
VFIDRSLGRYEVPEGLRAVGFKVYAMADVYGEEPGQRKADTAWIPDVTSKGWVVFSKDNALSSGEERECIIDCGARVFLLPEVQMAGREQVKRFVTHRFRIAQHCRRSGPFIYKLLPKRPERVSLG